MIKKGKTAFLHVTGDMHPDKNDLLIKGVFLAMAVIWLFSPEIAAATSLEGQLTAVNGTVSKAKIWGVSGASILVLIGSIVKGNIKLAGLVVAIGVIGAFYLQWIDGGMKLA